MALDATSVPGRADVMVVGAGAAGLYRALVAARQGARVTLVSRSPLAESASYEALLRLAGLRRTREGPEEPRQDRFAPARLIAPSALPRTESRGAHQRADRSVTDSGLDATHLVVTPDGGGHWRKWR